MNSMNVYYIKAGREEIRIKDIKNLLEQTYWANLRDIETIKKSIDNSLCYGAFLVENGKQIGFARVITDYATTYYICDVIVDENYRGMGIGKALLDSIHENKEVSSLRGILLLVMHMNFIENTDFRMAEIFIWGNQELFKFSEED